MKMAWRWCTSQGKAILRSNGTPPSSRAAASSAVIDTGNTATGAAYMARNKALCKAAAWRKSAWLSARRTSCATASVTAGGSGVWRRRNLAILPATTASFCRGKSLLHCLGQQPLYELRRRTGCLPLFEYADSHSPSGARGFTEQHNDLLQRRFHLGWLWIAHYQF